MISNIIDNSGPATSRGVLSELYHARSSAFPSSAPGHVYNFTNCSVTLMIIQPRKAQVLARSTPEKIIIQDSESK